MRRFIGSLFEALGSDLRFGLRHLRRNAAFSALVVSTLAFGIGANTAIFSVFNAVLLRSLPYPEPERLVRFAIDVETPRGAQTFDALPAAVFGPWREASETLERIALYDHQAVTLATADGPRRLGCALACPDLFELLGVPAGMGTTLAAAGRVRDARVAVLAHSAWRQYFSRDPQIVGRSIVLDGDDYRVAGVMPQGFAFPDDTVELWLPLLLGPGEGRGRMLPAIARTRPEVPLAAVEQEGQTLIRALEQAAPGPAPPARLRVATLKDRSVREVRPALGVLMGAVALVLLISSVNVASLLLARGSARQRELAIRMALGAGRARLARQLLIESGLLAAVSGGLGLLLAHGGLQILLRGAPAELPRLHEADLDPRVMGFAIAVSMATGLLFGLFSTGKTLQFDALRSRRPSSTASSSSMGLHGTGPQRLLRWLAGAEVALTMVLLVGAGLLIGTFAHLIAIDPGLTPRGGLVCQLDLPESRYAGSRSRMAFHDALLGRLRQMPEVESVGLATALSHHRTHGRFPFTVDGSEADLSDPLGAPVAEVRNVSEGYFEAMGIPLLAGRGFAASDRAGAEPVAIVSETLALRYFADRDPVGEWLHFSAHGDHRIVGVARDVPRTGLESEPGPAVYTALRQNADMLDWLSGMHVVVRAEGDPRRLVPALRGSVLSIDPQLPLFNVRTLEQDVARAIASPRFNALVLTLFAALALGMASVGVYGVVSYSVTQRTREIGVRIALGATGRQVLVPLLRGGFVILVSGIVVGLAAALALGRWLSSLLHGVDPADPTTLARVVLLLLATGMFAVYLPSRRATRIDPVEALRAE